MTSISMNIIGTLHLVEPLIQSALTTWLGFRTNQDIWAFIYLTYFSSFAIVSLRARKAEQRRTEVEFLRRHSEEEEEAALLQK